MTWLNRNFEYLKILTIVFVHNYSSQYLMPKMCSLSLPVNPISLQVHPLPHPLLSFLFYLAAGVSFVLLGWDRCQSHPCDLSNCGVCLSFNSIFRFCCRFLLWRRLGALPHTRVQVLLAQAVVATGGVKDVGLELGACGLFTSRRHGGDPHYHRILSPYILPSYSIIPIHVKP